MARRSRSRPGAKRGRPTELTPEVAKAIEEAVRVGVPVGTAARRVGLSEEAAYGWIRRGEDRSKRHSEPHFVDFAERIRKAEADDETRRIAQIAKVAAGGEVAFRRTVTKADGAVVVEERLLPPEWTANAWHLERKYPERWARHDHGGPAAAIMLRDGTRAGIVAQDGGIVVYLPDNGRPAPLAAHVDAEAWQDNGRPGRKSGGA